MSSVIINAYALEDFSLALKQCLAKHKEHIVVVASSDVHLSELRFEYKDVNFTSVEFIQNKICCDIGGEGYFTELLLIKSIFNESILDDVFRTPIDNVNIELLSELFNEIPKNSSFDEREKEFLYFLIKKLRDAYPDSKLFKLLKLKESWSPHPDKKYIFMGVPETFFSMHVLKKIMDSGNGVWITNYQKKRYLPDEVSQGCFVNSILQECNLGKYDILSFDGAKFEKELTLHSRNYSRDEILNKVRQVKCESESQKEDLICSMQPVSSTIVLDDMSIFATDYTLNNQIISFMLNLIDIVTLSCDSTALLDLLRNPLHDQFKDESYLYEVFILQSEILVSCKFIEFGEIYNAVKSKIFNKHLLEVFEALSYIFTCKFPTTLDALVQLHINSAKAILGNKVKFPVTSNYDIAVLSNVKIQSLNQYRNIAEFALYEFYKVKVNSQPFYKIHENVVISFEYLSNYKNCYFAEYINYVVWCVLLQAHKIFVICSANDKRTKGNNCFYWLIENHSDKECYIFESFAYLKKEQTLSLSLGVKKELLKKISINDLKDLCFDKNTFIRKCVFRAEGRSITNIKIYPNNYVDYIENVVNLCDSFGINSSLEFIKKHISLFREPLFYRWINRFANAFAKYYLPGGSYFVNFDCNIFDDISVNFKCDQVRVLQDNEISIMEYNKYYNLNSDEQYCGLPAILLLKAAMLSTMKNVSEVGYLYMEDGKILTSKLEKVMNYNLVIDQIREQVDLFLKSDIKIDEQIDKAQLIKNFFDQAMTFCSGMPCAVE